MIPQEQDQINELLFRLLDNEISDRDLLRLNHWLRTDPQARLYYCQFMEDTSALTLRGAAAIEPEPQDLPNDILGEHFWRQMVEEEKNAPALELTADEIPEPQPPDVVRHKPAARSLNRVSLSAAVLSAAALIFMIVMVHLAPPLPSEVATVCDSMNAQWSSDLPIEPGTRIASLSKPIRLTQGIVKLITDENVEVVLEGPTEFEFISYSQIALQYGKLFARVSEQGLGFSVTTPNSKIIDLGTEFGVLCHLNGDTEVYVYKGKANLVAGQKSDTKTSQFLPAGSARKVHSKDSGINEIALNPGAVVRTIDSKTQLVWKGRPLCLADLVGGGSGFGGGTLNAGIEASTGRMISRLADSDTHTVPDGYRPAAGHPFVDGVFVPGGAPAKTQIASDGLTSVRFPATSGAVWGYIFNGASHEGTTTPRHQLRLDGAAFGTRDHPAITIHSNQGITFDLSKIRDSIPGLAIEAFDSLIGVSQTVQEALESEQGRSFDDFPEVKKVFDAGYSKVEFWVFLDGKQVFHQERSSAEGACPIRIPIAKTDRFLTLAATESDDTHAYDWALFGRPKLTLESAEK